MELGTIRFRGATKFAAGEWFGVELDKNVGKNDGSVNGVRYFECAPQRGIFVREGRLHSPTRIMSKGEMSMLRRSSDCHASEPIAVRPVAKLASGGDGECDGSAAPPSQPRFTRVDGTRAELLERLWNRADTNGDGTLGGEEFKRLILAVTDDVEEDSILATFENLVAEYSKEVEAEEGEAGPKGLDFAFFVDLCGEQGLDVDDDQLRRGLRTLQVAAAAQPGQEAAAIRIQKTERARRARREVEDFKRTQAVLVPAGYLREAMGHGGAAIICILGEGSQAEETEELARATAKALVQRVGTYARFATGGTSKVQEAFAGACGEGSLVWNLVPQGQASGFAGDDVEAGTSDGERSDILARVGDIYITFGGGPETALQARVALSGGAVVLPMARTGGASGGLHEFPAAALQRHPLASEDQWAALTRPEIPAATAATAVADIIRSLIGARLVTMHEHETATAHWQQIRPHLKAVCSATSHLAGKQFNAEQALGYYEAAEAVEAEYEALVAQWKPRGARSGAGLREAGQGGLAPAPEAPLAAPGPSERAPTEPPPLPRRPAARALAAVGFRAGPLAARVVPPPPASGPAAEDLLAMSRAHADDIEECRRRMEAQLELVRERVENATVRVQAAARGRQVRKTMTLQRGGTSAAAPPTEAGS